MRMADGYFAPEDLRWFDSIIDALPNSNQPIIFVTHYPLNDEIANWYEMLDRLKNVNTQVVYLDTDIRIKSMILNPFPELWEDQT